jgi:hypothetical protein
VNFLVFSGWISHWTNAKGNVQPTAIAMAFYRGAGIVCKRNQEAIDLFIPVLLNSERKWWKENDGLPIYHDSKQWYFAPAEWNQAQISRVLLNFSAILVQVKNCKRISVAQAHKCHDKIEKRADIIFQTRNKRCVSLFYSWETTIWRILWMIKGELSESLCLAWRDTLMRAAVTINSSRVSSVHDGGRCWPL